MKKSIYFLFAAAALLASCTSDDIAKGGNDDTSDDAKTVFTATIEGGVTTRSTLGTTKDAKTGLFPIYWTPGDIIAINGNGYVTSDNDTVGTFVPKWGDAGKQLAGSAFTAAFPVSIAKVSADNVAYTIPSTYTISYGDGTFDMPMCAVSNEPKLHFRNVCGVLAITVHNSEMDSIAYLKVSAEKRLNGEFTPTASGVVEWKTPECSASTDSTLIIHYSKIVKPTAAGTTLYIPLMPGTYKNLKVRLYGGGVVKMITPSDGDLVINRSEIARCNAPCQKCAFVEGKFTVGVNRKKTVMFTLGNLYWNGSEWKMEERQTDYQSTWNTNHVDHLTWVSIKDYQTGNVAYMPYQATYGYSTAVAEDVLWCAELNPITVEGVSGLYIPSTQEFDTLFSFRQNSANLFKMPVTVGNMSNCIIIAPDDYDFNNKPLSSTYSSLDELNRLGIICFPPMGWGNVSTTFSEVNTQITVWTSTPSGSYAYNWWKSGSGRGVDTPSRARKGCYRLVR